MIDNSNLSPMMQHYVEMKNEYKDCILFYRLGDFYEMFFDDAIIVSKELELTLTGKDCGLDERAPMCGVPYHAADIYINRLIKKGYKVAIAEQVEDPKKAKGLVKREIIKIVTPGTVINETALDASQNNYLMDIAYISGRYGICTVDISTGDCKVTQASDSTHLIDEIHRLSPNEIICNKAFEISGIDINEALIKKSIPITALDDSYYSESMAIDIIKEHFGISDINGLGLDGKNNAIIAIGSTLRYLYDTQKNACNQITAIDIYQTGDYMVIDAASTRNLELVESMREKDKRGTLLWVLDKTKTAMGARLLRSYIEEPLIDADEISARQEVVEELKSRYTDREELREYLDPIYDLERIIGRVVSGNANPRDLISFKTSLEMLPHIKNIIKLLKAKIFKDIYENLDELKDIYDLIERSIDDDPPLVVREGDIIKSGYNEEIDKLRIAKTDGKNWLAELEMSEKEKTGIKNLKIKYNKVFGYYFEVTNSYKGLVPDYFIRKQTLANAERYTTDKLKDLEDTILGAQDRLFLLEYDLFCQIKEEISKEIIRIQKVAKIIARIDVYASLAAVADRYGYVRPNINNKGIIQIKDGRHPVVEQMILEGTFIPNDTLLDMDKNLISIITGPNMAGKSTYLRQTALIVLMAQMGSFVPAKSADICICDRIFTRVGASDDLASGQSTFMVEMSEVANILRNATNNSLIILDEIGRGTSTFDGLAIAWSVVEYIRDPQKIGAKTLFATHYHELTELEGTLHGINNCCIAVKEQGDDIIFLRKIVKGGADKSYGIQVAKLAGVPSEVIERAKELVEELSNADIATRAKEIAAMNIEASKNKFVDKSDNIDNSQLSLFDAISDDNIIEELKGLDILKMTPLEALNTLYKLQSKIVNRWKSDSNE